MSSVYDNIYKDVGSLQIGDFGILNNEHNRCVFNRKVIADKEYEMYLMNKKERVDENTK